MTALSERLWDQVRASFFSGHALGCLRRPDRHAAGRSPMNSSPSHHDRNSPAAPATSRRFSLAAAVVLAALASTASAQQQARQQPARGEPAAPAKDYNQHSLEIYEFRKAAQSGPARGEEIYFYKCWMCHNELAQGGAPKLGGLFKRTTLVTGDPLNDDTVRNQIRNGSANMPT